MLNERVAHEILQKLLNDLTYPSPDDMEAMCMLVSTIGAMLDSDRNQVRTVDLSCKLYVGRL